MLGGLADRRGHRWHLRSPNSQQLPQFAARLALVQSLRVGVRGNVENDFFEGVFLPISLEFVAQYESVTFPVGQLRHDDASGRVAVVAPHGPEPFRVLVPPCHAQAEHFAPWILRMFVLDKGETTRAGTENHLALTQISFWS